MIAPRGIAPVTASDRQLALLSLAAFASMTTMRVCDPLLPALAHEFGVTTGVAAQVISGFAIAYGLLQLLYGPLADRYGKFRVVSVAVLGCAASNLASALAPTLGWLVAFRAATGGTAAAIIPLTMAWIGDSVGYERRQEVLARLLSATVVGMIAGQWAGGIFADTLGWRSVFVALALLFAASGIVMQFEIRRTRAVAPGPLRRSPAPAQAGFARRLREVVAERWAREVLAVSVVEGAIAYSAFAFVPSYLHQRFGLSMAWAGAVLALYGVGGFCYSRIAPHMLSRWGESGLARRGGVVLGVIFAVLAAMPHWGWALPACFAGGLGFYMLHNTLQTHATQMAPKVRGTAVSLFSCALFFGQSIGVVAASWVVDHLSARALFAAAAVALPVLAWGFAARIGRRAGIV